ncbi:MAG: hypothetical protein ACRC3Z_13200 [Phocaeicola sp.]
MTESHASMRNEKPGGKLTGHETKIVELEAKVAGTLIELIFERSYPIHVYRGRSCKQPDGGVKVDLLLEYNGENENLVQDVMDNAIALHELI